MATRASTRVEILNTHNLLPDSQWAPISGWALEAIGSLAERTGRDSLLTFACRSRPRWRQSVFMALALDLPDDGARFLSKSIGSRSNPSDDSRSVADVLPALSPAQILDACFDTRPAGLLGVLGKVGFQTLDKETYRLLASWFALPKHASHFISALQGMTEIDQARMDVLSVLNPVLLKPALLSLTNTKAAAHQLNAAMNLIKEVCSSATDEALKASAHEMQGQTTISAWCVSWLRRADRFPPPPFVGDEECFPLTTAAQIIEAGQRFKNCLGTRYLAPGLAAIW